MGGATAKNYASDRCAAAGAGFAFASVNAVAGLERAPGVVGVTIVAKSAAAVMDGAAEDGFDGAEE